MVRVTIVTYSFSPAGAVKYRNLWPGLLDGQPVARDIAVRGRGSGSPGGPRA